MPALLRVLPAWMLIATPLFAKVPVYSLHEWGTFTTLSTSKGKPLSGLFLDETPLSESIYSLDYFHPKTPMPAASPNTLRGVTVKMETPVIYFHSQDSFKAQVHVRFRGGSITQWFPQCSSHEVNPTSPVTLSAQTQGGASWNVKILAPGNKPANTIRNGSQEWNAPRFAESNSVQSNNGDVEEFLFYRGLGGFTLPLTLKIADDGALEMKYEGSGEIPFVLVTETPRIARGQARGGLPVMKVRWKGPLATGQLKRIDRSDSIYAFPGSRTLSPLGQIVDDRDLAWYAIDTLEHALVSAGLKLDEAKSMLDTWRSSYFDQEFGLKVFWILPRPLVDSLLPLTVAPVPKSIRRVFVGRSEILTPAFEKLLINAKVYSKDSLKTLLTDRFQYAYQEFLAQNYAVNISAQALQSQSSNRKLMAQNLDLLGRHKASIRPMKKLPWLECSTKNCNFKSQ